MTPRTFLVFIAARMHHWNISILLRSLWMAAQLSGVSVGMDRSWAWRRWALTVNQPFWSPLLLRIVSHGTWKQFPKQAKICASEVQDYDPVCFLNCFLLLGVLKNSLIMLVLFIYYIFSKELYYIGPKAQLYL